MKGVFLLILVSILLVPSVQAIETLTLTNFDVFINQPLNDSTYSVTSESFTDIFNITWDKANRDKLGGDNTFTACDHGTSQTLVMSNKTINFTGTTDYWGFYTLSPPNDVRMKIFRDNGTDLVIVDSSYNTSSVTSGWNYIIRSTSVEKGDMVGIWWTGGLMRCGSGTTGTFSNLSNDVNTSVYGSFGFNQFGNPTATFVNGTDTNIEDEFVNVSYLRHGHDNAAIPIATFGEAISTSTWIPSSDPEGVGCNGTHLFVSDEDNDEIEISYLNGSSYKTITGVTGIVRGITLNDSKMWTLSVPIVGDNEIQRRDLNGTLDGVTINVSPEVLEGFGYGIANNNTHLFIVDNAQAKVFRYNMDGTYETEFSTSGVTSGPYDITHNGDHIYISTGNLQKEIYKYNTDGTYTQISMAGNQTAGAGGICANSSFLWSLAGTTITKHNLTFNYTNLTNVIFAWDNINRVFDAPQLLEIFGQDIWTSNSINLTLTWVEEQVGGGGGSPPPTATFLHPPPEEEIAELQEELEDALEELQDFFESGNIENLGGGGGKILNVTVKAIVKAFTPTPVPVEETRGIKFELWFFSPFFFPFSPFHLILLGITWYYPLNLYLSRKRVSRGKLLLASLATMLVTWAVWAGIQNYFTLFV